MWKAAFALVLLISTIHGQYQIHFEQREYTFAESSDVCVIVRHDGGPAPMYFSISYAFDAALIGQRSREIPATQLFQQGATTIRLCLPSSGSRDNQVCENDTHGTITLINSSAIRLVEPSITRVTVTDDEFEFASFSQSAYTFEEGSTQHLPLTISSSLSKSINFHLTPEPVLDASSPLTLLTTQLDYESDANSAGIDVQLRDNDIALEPPQEVILGIRLSSSQCYDLTIIPTYITLLDDDVVTLGFRDDVLQVSESEGKAVLCVSISHVIARPLNFIITHDSITSENQVKGGSLFGQMPAHSNRSEQCFTVPFLTDDIIDDGRRFTASLAVDKDNYPGVILSNNIATVSILDTSKCHDVDISNSTEQEIEVPPLSSVCFHCHFRDDNSENGDISWKIGGLVLQSDVGEVLQNGTLQVTNSSSVFKKNRVAMLSCSSRKSGNEFTFLVFLQGGHVQPMPTPGKTSANSAFALHRITLYTLHISTMTVFITSFL